jgi:Mg-chelatase subunit ChlD
VSLVTFDKVKEYLLLEVKEEKILKLLAASPTVFTLSQEQVDELRLAGASNTVLDAMQKGPTAGPTAGESDIGAFVIILDCSGSMKDVTTEGRSKFAAAQRAACELIESIPVGRQLAFIVYGHNTAEGCQAVDVSRPLARLDAATKDELRRSIGSLNPIGHTPIALSLERAGEEVEKTKALAKVVLITDGMETCHADPCAAAARLAAMPNMVGGLDVIGFALKQQETQAVAKIAQEGRGKFYNAQSANELYASVNQVKAEIVQAPAKKPKLSARVVALIERIADDDWQPHIGWGVDEKKEAAVNSLLKLAPDQVVGALLKAMQSKTAEVRQWASGHKLIETGDDERISTALRTLVGDKNTLVRRNAARLLGVRGDREAADLLAQLVANDSWQPSLGWGIDESKVAALTSLRTLDADRVEETLLKAMKSKTSGVRNWATERLGDTANE